ncbi:uncharacterized protein LOC120678413 [Panicum virgatum]|uniref:uncharacterized protein LOC120678413 n=1 Tax=Panicum virgatum TaxID=38727 RepID=UPI0019D6222C|nr:uncharacterized protein LOC120678413 [Panicum virgatum]
MVLPVAAPPFPPLRLPPSLLPPLCLPPSVLPAVATLALRRRRRSLSRYPDPDPTRGAARREGLEVRGRVSAGHGAAAPAHRAERPAAAVCLGRPRWAVSHHLRRGGGKVNCEAVARESMPAGLLDVLREAKRNAPILPQVGRHPLAGLLAPVLCPHCHSSPGSSAPHRVSDPASALLALAFLSAAATVAPLPLLPADAAAITARLLLEFPTSEDVPRRKKGKREEANNGGIRDVVRSFKEEQVEELERMKVAFRSRPVRNAAARQVRSLMDFLKASEDEVIVSDCGLQDLSIKPFLDSLIS